MGVGCQGESADTIKTLCLPVVHSPELLRSFYDAKYFRDGWIINIP
jgi:hypothetical protein